MNYYNEIKNELIKSEIYDKAKDCAKDKNKVKVYYEIERLLSKAGKEYGKNIIKNYSEKLIIEVGKKYNERNLRYMRQFYEVFSVTKWNPVGSKLSWSHITELKKEHIGQMQIYMNYIDENIKTIGENETVGIIICKQDNEYIIKYCSDERIITREYVLV